MRQTHLYQVDGVRVPSVTEVLKLAGLVDLSAIPAQTLEIARQRGADVHAWLEALDLGLLDDTSEPDERITGYVAGYRRFRDETGFEPDLIEHVVVNSQYRFAGTLDRTGRIGDRRILADLKATAGIDPSVRLQLAGYELALGDRYERVALQLHDDGTYTLHRFSSRDDTHDFIAAVRIAHFRLRHSLAAIEE